MDLSICGIITNYLPKAPSIVKTIIQAPLGWSPNAKYQDWLTEVIVQCARPALQSPAALLKSQEFFRWDVGIWGNMWVAKNTIPAPMNPEQINDSKDDGGHISNALDMEQAVTFSIDVLANHDDERQCPIPRLDAKGLEVEWTSYRRDARPWSPMPHELSNQDVYDRMLLELPQGSDSPVILFAHGGAFCLMDPANHRHFAARLSNNTNSRVLAVRYRLSPQSIFPAALMDMFLAYLCLLCPPPGSLHAAVPGSKIVLAGDSSGGNLATSLQVLLSTLVLHGKTRIRNPWLTKHADNFITIPDPPTAALSVSSPWLDITRSLPSCNLNSRYDIIAPPEPLQPSLMSTSPMFPPDEIWPAKPVRTETYCEAVMCAHPLVSPLTTPTDVLEMFPAFDACTGWEGMTDETEVFIRRLAEARKEHHDAKHHIGQLVFDGYIGMPHTFAFMPYNQAGVKADKNRANHIKNAVNSLNEEPTTIGHSCPRTDNMGRATWTNAKTMKETNIPLTSLGLTSEFSGYTRVHPITDDFMFAKVEEGRAFRVDLERRLREQEKAQEMGKA